MPGAQPLAAAVVPIQRRIYNVMFQQAKTAAGAGCMWHTSHSNLF
jgi:hypothetical protein